MDNYPRTSVYPRLYVYDGDYMIDMDDMYGFTSLCRHYSGTLLNCFFDEASCGIRQQIRCNRNEVEKMVDRHRRSSNPYSDLDLCDEIGNSLRKYLDKNPNEMEFVFAGTGERRNGHKAYYLVKNINSFDIVLNVLKEDFPNFLKNKYIIKPCLFASIPARGVLEQLTKHSVVISNIFEYYIDETFPKYFAPSKEKIREIISRYNIKIPQTHLYTIAALAARRIFVVCVNDIRNKFSREFDHTIRDIKSETNLSIEEEHALRFKITTMLKNIDMIYERCNEYKENIYDVMREDGYLLSEVNNIYDRFTCCKNLEGGGIVFYRAPDLDKLCVETLKNDPNGVFRIV